MDPSKTLIEVWGVPGVFILALGAYAMMLLKRVFDVMDQRVKDAEEHAAKLAEVMREQTNSLRELATVVRDALTRIAK